MVALPTPADLAVQMLNAQDVPAAAGVLGDWLLEVTGAVVALRVRLGAAVGDVAEVMPVLRIELPPPSEWPGPDRLREHPLSRFHRATGCLLPAVLRDVESHGWRLDDSDREEIDRLHLTEHQMTVPTVDSSAVLRTGTWLGWVIVAEHDLGPRVVERVASAMPTIVGADRHLGLLAGLSPALLGRAQRPRDPSCPSLTARERIILTMLAQGRTAVGIATRLAISPRTVHKHQEHLYRKLGAVDRLSAVLAAQQLGLVPVPVPVPVVTLPAPEAHAGPVAVRAYSSGGSVHSAATIAGRTYSPMRLSN